MKRAATAAIADDIEEVDAVEEFDTTEEASAQTAALDTDALEAEERERAIAEAEAAAAIAEARAEEEAEERARAIAEAEAAAAEAIAEAEAEERAEAQAAAAAGEPLASDVEADDDAPTGVAHEVPDREDADDEDEDEDDAPTGVAHPIPEAAPRMPSAAPALAAPAYAPGASAPPAPPTAPMIVGSSLPPPPPVAPTAAVSLPPPPSVPNAAPPPPHAAAASEWDEAPTSVYVRDSLRPQHEPPVVSGSVPPLTAARTVPGMRAPRVDTMPPQRLVPSTKLYVGMAAVAAVALAFAFIPFGPKTGDLVINVAGQEGVAVDGVKVYLDEKLICEDSPCQVGEIEAVGHVVTAEAEGYTKTAALAVLVKPDDTTIHNVDLVKAKTNTGISVPKTPGEDIELAVDGKEFGKLPQRLDDLEPGKHSLTFTGGERYDTLQRTVELEKGNILALEPVKLPVLKGIAKFTAGQQVDGATVTLDGKAITLPHSAELSGKKSHRLVAKKEGFESFDREFEFEPGEPELSIEVSLSPEGEVAEIDADEAVASATTASASASNATKASSGHTTRSVSAKRSTNKASAKASGNGKLTLLSVPSVMVILDGKPVGKTPKRAMSVSPGTHSVVFVHPSKGRKRSSAKVTPGGSKTVAVRF